MDKGEIFLKTPFTSGLSFNILYAGSSYCGVTSISERGWYNMSTYETLSLMIAFGVLIVMIIGTKKQSPAYQSNSDYFLIDILWKPLTGVNCLFCTFIINQFPFICQSRFFSLYIQSYWNASEHIAVADKKDIDGVLIGMIHLLYSVYF